MKCHQLITRPLTSTEICTAALDACSAMLQMFCRHLVFLFSSPKPECGANMYLYDHCLYMNPGCCHFLCVLPQCPNPIKSQAENVSCAMYARTWGSYLNSAVLSLKSLAFVSRAAHSVSMRSVHLAAVYSLCSSWMIKLIVLSSSTRQYKCGDNRITGLYSNECIVTVCIQTAGLF